MTTSFVLDSAPSKCSPRDGCRYSPASLALLPVILIRAIEFVTLFTQSTSGKECWSLSRGDEWGSVQTHHSGVPPGRAGVPIATGSRPGSMPLS